MSIHYNLGTRSPNVSKARVATLLDQAIQAHQQGRFAQANQLYNTVLKIDPKNVGALHMQGVLAYQVGQLQVAVDLIAQAIKHAPEDAAPYVNSGLALGALQRHEDALAQFERAICLRPDFAEAYLNRGITLMELGQPLDAIASYDQAIALEPLLAAAYNNKGNALRKLKRPDEALECFRQALALDPKELNACQNMGLLHVEAGRSEDALRCFDQVLMLRPQHAEALNGKGVSLALQERWEEAVFHFTSAIQFDDNLVQAHKNLGNALCRQLRITEAVLAYQKTVQLSPNDVEAHLQLALSLLDVGRYTEASSVYGRAILLTPDGAESYFNRANLHIRFKRHKDAVADYLAAYELKPDAKFLIGSIASSRMKMSDWKHLQDDLARCQQSIFAGKEGVSPFVALSLFDSPAIQKQVAQILVAQTFQRSTALGPIQLRARDEKIRVGYYSADFHNHATAYLIAELFEAHDRTHFEWIAFSFGPPVQDAMRERIVASFDQFIDVREKRDIDIAQLSRELGIDIAIDLKGFTTDSRFGIFAYRCAPVQVSYLGYPGTTGADYMDYVIADKVIMPPEMQEHFTEKAVYLPHSYQVNDSRRAISDRVFTREGLGLPRAGFVFCCFNNNYKIMPSVFDSWMRILKALPGSVLWLLEDNPAIVDNLRREAELRDVNGDRLVFAKRMPLDEHLARHQLADLFLDTLPYNAHTTASDALWAGLPVLTCLGKSFAGRVAASLLHAVGLSELVTNSTSEYEALAISIAKDPARLRALREQLIAQKSQSPLFNARLFARDVEAAYMEMHERRLRGLTPDAIDVARLGSRLTTS
jgi:predicted O-linked N-acetylglucosamine transferase (SPINDLY family)